MVIEKKKIGINRKKSRRNPAFFIFRKVLTRDYYLIIILPSTNEMEIKMSERKSVFEVVVDIEAKVLEKFDNGLLIDLIAYQLDVTCKRVELILQSNGRI